MSRKSAIHAARSPLARPRASSPGAARQHAGRGAAASAPALRGVGLVVLGYLPRSRWVEAANDPRA